MKINTVGLIYIRNYKILCVRAKNKNLFYLPGGKKKKDETNIEALIREAKEEISVDLIPETIKKHSVFEGQADSKSNGIIIVITSYTAEFSGVLKANNEIEEFQWLSYSDKNKIPLAGYQVFDKLKKDGLLE